jgi:hypothetical protein
MGPTYSDRWITCTDDEIRVRGYYFPWGTKRIPYERIRAVRQVSLSALRGRGRIWGTANPRYWASLDPARPRKSVGLVLDIGQWVRPFLTPDEPPEVIEAIRRHTGIGETDVGGGAGPLI